MFSMLGCSVEGYWLMPMVRVSRGWAAAGMPRHSRSNRTSRIGVSFVALRDAHARGSAQEPCPAGRKIRPPNRWSARTGRHIRCFRSTIEADYRKGFPMNWHRYTMSVTSREVVCPYHRNHLWRPYCVRFGFGWCLRAGGRHERPDLHRRRQRHDHRRRRRRHDLCCLWRQPAERWLGQATFHRPSNQTGSSRGERSVPASCG